jgi:MOSC domain-containing protein YiiM
MTEPNGIVTAVSADRTHRFSKLNQDRISVIEGLGVDGDAHAGVTVQHRSRVQRDPSQPNLRQIHLIHAELHDELRSRGFDVGAGAMGENVTTRGIDLLGLPTGAQLRLGESAVIQITGLRNPCVQLESLGRGLMQAVLDRDAEGRLIRKAGVMGVILRGGDIRPGDPIRTELPAPPYRSLEPV